MIRNLVVERVIVILFFALFVGYVAWAAAAVRGIWNDRERRS